MEKKKILIVEDDTFTQDAYREYLESSGYEVFCAGTAHEGLALLDKKPDLVILDIMLPNGMHGFDMLERMKIDEKTKNIPVIIASNLDSEQGVARTIGASAYLVKVNTSLDQLLAKVKELIK